MKDIMQIGAAINRLYDDNEAVCDGCYETVINGTQNDEGDWLCEDCIEDWESDND